MFLAKSYCDIGNYVVGMGKGIFYCTNRALASVGTNLFVNYSYL